MYRRCSGVILIFLLMNGPVSAQDDGANYKNRICVGLGGENGYLGADYSRDIYRSKFYVGIGCGLGTGWTGYVRYEPLNWKGLRPFVSSGAAYSFGGTLTESAGTSVFSSSAGLNYMPGRRRRKALVLGVGLTYYSILKGETKGAINGWGPLIKAGLAF